MKKRLVLPLAALAAVPAWQNRGLLRSVGARGLAAMMPNPAKDRGLDIRIPIEYGGWTRLTLKVDLGPALSGVVEYPVEAAAYSHFGGFNLSRVYSDFVNPDSPYYQAWIGVYVVFDGDSRKHFGFDEDGEPISDDVLAVLEADQRLVLRGAGCPHFFDDGRRVRLTGELSRTQVTSAGEEWWRMDGRAETWSAYHRGGTPGGHWRSDAGYGRVPDGARHPVDDFHPLQYCGSFWQRYVPEWGVTCAKFYIYPEYTDKEGRSVTHGGSLRPECEAVIEAITFTMRG